MLDEILFVLLDVLNSWAYNKPLKIYMKKICFMYKEIRIKMHAKTHFNIVLYVYTCSILLKLCLTVEVQIEISIFHRDTILFFTGTKLYANSPMNYM